MVPFPGRYAPPLNFAVVKMVLGVMVLVKSHSSSAEQNTTSCFARIEKRSNLCFAARSIIWTSHQLDIKLICHAIQDWPPTLLELRPSPLGKPEMPSAMAICRPMCQALGVRIYVAHFLTPPCAQNWAWHFLIHCATSVPKVTRCRPFSVTHGSIPTLVSCALITSSCAIAMFLWVQS